MEELLLNIFFWGIFVGGGTAFALFAFFMAAKQYRRDTAKRKEAGSAKMIEPDEQEVTPVTVKATVIDQSCSVKMVGIKTPKTVKVFTVIFQTETGEVLSLNVPEEMYDGFEVGQVGDLSMADGELYGFELQQPASEG